MVHFVNHGSIVTRTNTTKLSKEMLQQIIQKIFSIVLKMPIPRYKKCITPFKRFGRNVFDEPIFGFHFWP